MRSGPVPGHPWVTNSLWESCGEDAGPHARIAVGMAALPLNNAVAIAAEVEFAP